MALPARMANNTKSRRLGREHYRQFYDQRQLYENLIYLLNET